VASDDELEDQLESVELLGEPVRRALYLHVSRQPGEVSRDEAAAAVKVSRELAAFHLDKLVRAKLLEPVYRRLSGRSGPGAGRPSKLYRRARGEITINLPPREYQLASRIFARALGLDDATELDPKLRDAAHELGVDIGRQARGGRRGLLRVLESYGYEPFEDGPTGKIRLRNCPFHALAQDFQQPVCGMNLAFLEGVREAAGAANLTALLEPADGYCCVSFSRAE
jgi:predicted ArsR family transcriptional regulator